MHLFCITHSFSFALLLGMRRFTLPLTSSANSYSGMLREMVVMYPSVEAEKLKVGSMRAARLSSNTAKSVAFRFSYSVATRHATAGFQREGHRSISNNITWLVTTLFSA